MTISWSAILAAALAPVVIRWSLSLANKRSTDGKHFRPVATLRALYPGGLIMMGWATAGCPRFAPSLALTWDAVRNSCHPFP
jgi:hypothetical protein